MPPTSTASDATAASIVPLPKVICTALIAEDIMKVEERLVPRKHFSPGLQPEPGVSPHMQDGTMTLSLPVSATTSKHCLGVPTHSLTLKKLPWFSNGVHVSLLSD